MTTPAPLVQRQLPVDAVTGTLAGAAATVVAEYDVRDVTRFGLLIQNTGNTNAIGTVEVFKSFDGTNYGPADAATTGLAIAHDDGAVLEFSDVAFTKLRVRLTSASGSTYRLTARGT